MNLENPTYNEHQLRRKNEIQIATLEMLGLLEEPDTNKAIEEWIHSGGASWFESFLQSEEGQTMLSSTTDTSQIAKALVKEYHKMFPSDISHAA
ncbi:hypothetical protein H6758_02220 [Candidatus Nomurabacteria bacterium]|nr:hypothetical protein [Candidatus Nomurabacteria bacterium]